MFVHDYCMLNQVSYLLPSSMFHDLCSLIKGKHSWPRNSAETDTNTTLCHPCWQQSTRKRLHWLFRISSGEQPIKVFTNNCGLLFSKSCTSGFFFPPIVHYCQFVLWSSLIDFVDHNIMCNLLVILILNLRDHSSTCLLRFLCWGAHLHAYNRVASSILENTDILRVILHWSQGCICC